MKPASLFLAGLGLILSALAAGTVRAQVGLAGSPVLLLLALAQPAESGGAEQEPAGPSDSEPALALPVNAPEPENADAASRSGDDSRVGGAETSGSRTRRPATAKDGAQPNSRPRTARTRVERGAGERQGLPPSTSRRRTNPSPKSTERRPGTNGVETVRGSGYTAFKIITDRNIFNASRSARSGPGRGEERPAPEKIETLSLVGTLSSEKGAYAFFDGSNSEFRKVLPVGKTVAGYTIAEITGSGVSLTSGTNKLDFQVGMQLRKEEGEWRLSASSKRLAQSSTAAAAPESESASADESDIVKRLMQQREQELK